jgi:hypothetical protein
MSNNHILHLYILYATDIQLNYNFLVDILNVQGCK